MKRWILSCLIVMMMVCAACAETRQGVVYLEGEAEPITETLYETPWGFSFWYDAETFDVIETVNNNEVTNICLSAKEGFAPASMDFMLPDSAMKTGLEYLQAMDGGIPESDYEQDRTEGGAALTGFAKADYSTMLSREYYVIADGDKWAPALIVCPMEAMEGLGRRLYGVLQTITFGPLPAVRVEDGEDQEALPSVFVSDDEYSVWVMFSARRPVTNFEVLDLEMTYDEANDSFSFNTETLYAREALTPDQPIRVRLAFYGDIPNNGVSFVDEDGTLCHYALDMSGEDGTLYLSAF